jgi:hypothetical protein
MPLMKKRGYAGTVHGKAGLSSVGDSKLYNLQYSGGLSPQTWPRPKMPSMKMKIGYTGVMQAWKNVML